MQIFIYTFGEKPDPTIILVFAENRIRANELAAQELSVSTTFIDDETDCTEYGKASSECSYVVRG